MLGLLKKNGTRLEFAVIGLGRFGANVARTLVQKGHTVLGVDGDSALVQRYAHEITQTVRLDSTDEEALREIDISSYPTVVVAIGSNLEAAILTTVALKAVGVQHVLCKAATTTARDVLLKVGADRVVLPEHDGGIRLADELSNPGLLVQIPLGAGDCVTELTLPDWLAGTPLNMADLKGRFGACVVAIVRGDKTMVPPPTATPLQRGDILVIIGPMDVAARITSGS